MSKLTELSVNSMGSGVHNSRSGVTNTKLVPVIGRVQSAMGNSRAGGGASAAAACRDAGVHQCSIAYDNFTVAEEVLKLFGK